MEAASTEAQVGTWARRRPAATPIEARSVAAYAAEGVGTFLLVFFICAILSVANAGTLRLDLAGLGLLHALTLGVIV